MVERAEKADSKINLHVKTSQGPKVIPADKVTGCHRYFTEQ